jgi:serine/threonine protein kinase
LNATCVVKQLHLAEPMAKELFRREAQQLLRLGDHPQLPALYAFFEDAGESYLVEQFIEGDTLTRTVQRKGAFSEEEVLALLGHLLPVLEYLESHSVVHRDIKPDNIMITASEVPVLIDFGVVKVIAHTAAQSQGTSVSSAGYTPFEQMSGKPTFASDVYSLGATCLFALTGKSPMELVDQSTAEWRWRSRVKHRISAEVARIIDKMVEPGLKDRYRSATETREDLLKVSGSESPQPTFAATVAPLRGAGGSTQPVGPVGPTPDRTTERGSLFETIVLVALLLGVGFLGYTGQRQGWWDLDPRPAVHQSQ